MYLYFNKLSDSTKIKLIVVLFILSNMIAFFFLNSSTMYKQQQIDEQLSAFALAQEKEHLFNEFFEEAKVTIEFLRNSETFNNYLKSSKYLDNVNKHFSDLAETHKDIMQIRYLDNKGNELIRIDRKEFNNTSKIVTATDLQNKAHRDYFIKAVSKNNEELIFSDMDLNVEHSNIEIPFNPTMRLMKPVIQKGKNIGVIVINYNLQELFKSILFSSMFDVMTVNSDGYTLLSPNKEQSWGYYRDPKVNIKQLFPDKFENILNNVSYYDNGLYSKQLALSTPMPLTIIVKPKKNYLNDLHTLHDRELLFFLGIMSLLSIAIGFIVNKMIQKLHKGIIEKNEALDDTNYYLNQFQQAVDAAAIFSTTDSKGIITYANHNFEKISGYSVDELVGKPHNIVRHPDMDKEIFAELWKTVGEGKIWKGLVKNRAKDGSDYYVVSEVAPIYGKDGKLKEYIGIRNDVTELEQYKQILQRKLNQTNLSKEEQTTYLSEYEDAISNNSAIAKTDLNLVIKDVNEKYTQLSKYSKEEMINKLITDFVDEESLQNVDEIIKTIHAGNLYKSIFKGKPKYGKSYYTMTLIKPIKNLEGKVFEFLMLKNDVTDLIELQQEIVETQKEVVEKMGAIGETRSKETGDHVKRVSEYSYNLAILYGLSEEEAILLKQASPMHDIGKVGIPDSVLNKPDKLTTEEFKIMKEHASIGYEMLKHSERSILKASAIVAYTHHEKWDGSGYPNGLKGKDIHIYGRITAVADVFDALGHDRVYKKAWPLEKILDLFKEHKGKHFDPEIIELFLENLDTFLQIKKKFDNK